MSTSLVVVGLGYVGVPMAVRATEAGLDVVGLDTNISVVDGLNAGKRFGRVADGFDLMMQGRLIVLELYDQMVVRDGGGFECFF